MEHLLGQGSTLILIPRALRSHLMAEAGKSQGALCFEKSTLAVGASLDVQGRTIWLFPQASFDPGGLDCRGVWRDGGGGWREVSRS